MITLLNFVCHSSWKKPRNFLIHDYCKFSENSLVKDILQLNWDSIVSNGDKDGNKWNSTFYKKINRIVNKRAPLRKNCKHNVKQLSKPWIKKGHWNSINEKNELFNSLDKCRYKIYWNKILTLSH